MDLLCSNCKKTFHRSWSGKRGDNSFCSRSCSAIFTNKKSPKRKPEGVCLSCASAIHSCKSYCSEECRRKAALARKAERDAARVGRPTGHAVISWRQRVKQKSLEYKGGKCSVCGYFRCQRALQFHHLDPSKKDFTISGKSKAWETIRQELDKCALVCANCHAEIHAGILST